MPLEALLAMLLAGEDAAAPSAVAASGATCPAGTVLVEGTHYEQVQRVCTLWRAHCLAFLPGLVALEPRATPVRTCMDEYEWPNRAGATPVVMVRFVDAEAECARAGKRLCTEFEWELACEGPRQLPWPYGFRNEPEACNASKPYREISQAKLASSERAVRERETRRLWQGEPSGARPRCRSEAGVADLVGNVEEWVVSSRPEWQYRSALKGGFWSKPWAGCRGTNDAHGPIFRFYEIGFRCCQDP